MSNFICFLEELEEGKGRVLTLPSGKEVLVMKKDGEVWALNNACPHKGGPLSEGIIEGNCVTCPWHGWEFDITSGDCLTRPNFKAEKIAIRVEEGRVYWSNPEGPLE